MDEVTRYDPLDLLPRLAAYDFPELGERLIREGTCSTIAEYNELFRELKRYLAICFISKQELQMTSKKIDAVWHQFILYTPQYSSFCEGMFGCYMHHTPYQPGEARADTRNLFASLYEQTYGEMPPAVWNPQPVVTSEQESCSTYQRDDDERHCRFYDCGQHR